MQIQLLNYSRSHWQKFKNTQINQGQVLCYCFIFLKIISPLWKFSMPRVSEKTVLFYWRSNRGSIVSYFKKHEAKNLLKGDEIAKGGNKLKSKSPQRGLNYLDSFTENSSWLWRYWSSLDDVIKLLRGKTISNIFSFRGYR